jgi:N-acetylmuramoyl-L-alanine amidase
MRILLKKLFILLLCSVIASLSSGQEGSKIKTVVIDAGHGGKDPGALGKHSKEKDIALAVALKTGAYIEKNLDVEVIYTRKDDRFIPLHKRADIANKANLYYGIAQK